MRAGPCGRLRKVSLTALLTASVLVTVGLVGTPAAFADHTNSSNTPFLLEFDYFWPADNTAGYTTFSGEPGTTSNPHNLGDPDCSPSANGMQATSWWKVKGSGRRMAVTSSRTFTDTSFDTVMAVYLDEDGVIGDLVGCNDDESDNTGSTVVFDSAPGEEYFVQVGGFNGATGFLQVVALTNPPGNDERAQAELVGPGTQVFRDNFGASPVDSVQNCGGNTYGKSVWFRFDAPDQGTMTFDVLAPFFTVLALFRADGSGPIACGDDFSTASARIETGELPAGTYYLEVGAAEDGDDPTAAGFNADEGFFLYQATFRADPDYDNDGAPNAQDRCPRVAGTGGVRDCPDPDNDGWADGIDDRCSGLSGRNANLHRGCPDNDGDDVPEGPGGSDACPTLNARQPATRIVRRDEQPRDGCPDTLRLHNLVVIKKSVQGRGYGIRLRFFRITGVPPGSRVVATCKAPGRRGCGKPLRVKRAATGEVRAQASRDFNFKAVARRPLRFGTRIVVRVTAPYATGKYYRLTVNRSDKRVAEFDGCTNAGSKRPKKTGCR